ncbi:hypothetical protein Nans01_21650 [Nocardiopsis ansamitocini]|uniref:Uncharacterized protein n=1 Tax=Nocardiopsis ansamitocini TaxID=1670832 RepID=A0A9W6P676_9ACTN|nr:hypothetical protein Nans01_21650 [Nocardiopsis ansamitocini]
MPFGEPGAPVGGGNRIACSGAGRADRRGNRLIGGGEGTHGFAKPPILRTDDIRTRAVRGEWTQPRIESGKTCGCPEKTKVRPQTTRHRKNYSCDPRHSDSCQSRSDGGFALREGLTRITAMASASPSVDPARGAHDRGRPLAHR